MPATMRFRANSMLSNFNKEVTSIISTVDKLHSGHDAIARKKLAMPVPDYVLNLLKLNISTIRSFTKYQIIWTISKLKCVVNYSIYGPLYMKSFAKVIDYAVITQEKA